MDLKYVHRGRLGLAWTGKDLVALDAEDAGDGSRSRVMLSDADLQWLEDTARLLRTRRGSLRTIEDAAAMVRVHEDVVRRWIAAERPETHVICGVVYVGRADVLLRFGRRRGITLV